MVFLEKIPLNIYSKFIYKHLFQYLLNSPFISTSVNGFFLTDYVWKPQIKEKKEKTKLLEKSVLIEKCRLFSLQNCTCCCCCLYLPLWHVCPAALCPASVKLNRKESNKYKYIDELDAVLCVFCMCYI